MSETEIEELLNKLESELNGDPDHDMDVMMDWGDRYRGDPDAEPLLHAISQRLLNLIMDEDGDQMQEIFDDMVNTADDDFAEACSLIRNGQNEEALNKLLMLTAVVRAYQLPDDAIWTDFDSYLDMLVFQDIYAEEIGDREIKRHPMHPAEILFTCGGLLIEMDRAEEAVEPLEMLLQLDPVCPRYLFELGEAYKRTGALDKALENAGWALLCAQNRADAARCYRDIAYCFSESGAYEDAMMLYLLSLRFQSSRQADAEIAWLRKKFGISAANYPEEKILQRCEELNIPTDLSDIVRRNIDFINKTSGDQKDDEDDIL